MPTNVRLENIISTATKRQHCCLCNGDGDDVFISSTIQIGCVASVRERGASFVVVVGGAALALAPLAALVALVATDHHHL